jgi:hypothetical protein
VNAFDTSGKSTIAKELQVRKRISQGSTRAVDAKRAMGTDPGRLYGLSKKWDERLISDPEYNYLTRREKTK